MTDHILVELLSSIVKHLPSQHDQTSHGGDSTVGEKFESASSRLANVDISSVLQDVREWSSGRPISLEKKKKIARYYTDLIKGYQPGNTADVDSFMAITHRLDKLRKDWGAEVFNEIDLENKHLAGKHDQKSHAGVHRANEKGYFGIDKSLSSPEQFDAAKRILSDANKFISNLVKTPRGSSKIDAANEARASLSSIKKSLLNGDMGPAGMFHAFEFEKRVNDVLSSYYKRLDIGPGFWNPVTTSGIGQHFSETKHLAGKHDQKEHGKTAMGAMQQAPKNVFEARKMATKVTDELSKMSKAKLPKELKGKLLAAAKQISAKGAVNTLPQMKPLMANAYRLMQEANKYLETGGKVKAPVPKPSAPTSKKPVQPSRPVSILKPKPTSIATIYRSYKGKKDKYNKAVQQYKQGKISGNYLKLYKQSFDRAALQLRQAQQRKSQVRY